MKKHTDAYRRALSAEAVDCQCRGPAQPHHHYWLPVKEMLGKIRWERGAHITVRKNNDAYTMTAI